MTFGQKLKQHRQKLGYTQKELADKLNVSFQTISKWESDINEPDFSSLRKLSEIFQCSVDSLISNKDEESEAKQEQLIVEEAQNTETEALVPVKEEEEKKEESPIAEKKPSDHCSKCGKDIYDGDKVHHVNKQSKSGVKEIVTICDECFVRHEKEIEERARQIDRQVAKEKDSKPIGLAHDCKKVFVWAIIIGIISLIITLIVCINNHETIGIPLTVILPIVIGYAMVSDIYCIFTDTFISEIFGSIATFSIKFPGLIFSFSLEGFAWLIAMKVLFAVLGFLIGLGAILLGLAISAVFSIFCFIPFVIRDRLTNKTLS